MKRKIACTIAGATGVLSSSFIFQACNKAESADELNQMLESNILSTPDAIGVPIGISLDSQDQEYIRFLHQLSAEIVSNPQTANEFAKNPKEYCLKYGYNQPLNLNQGLLKFIMALGDDAINDSIAKGDVNAYIRACKNNGLLELSSLNQDPYLKKLSAIINKEQHTSNMAPYLAITRTGVEANQEVIDNFSAVYGAVAIVIAAVAVEAFIVLGTTTWVTHVHESAYQESDFQQQNSMIEVWNLKNDGKADYSLTDKINNAIVEEGLSIIKENFPAVYENVDENTLRNLILLNISKNLPYEE